jgi:hypothetical protein
MQEATTNACSVTSHLPMNIYLYLFAPEVYHNAPVIQIIHQLPEQYVNTVNMQQNGS